LALLVVAACSPGAGGNPSTMGPSSSVPTTATSAAGLPSQTDTAWGRIWDALPPAFPAPPGAQPATDTGGGPASAQLAVGSATGDQTARFYEDALGDSDYSVDRDGPLEDGSIVVSATDGYQCRIQVTVLPVATGSIVTLLYGSGCPFV
jgi:hypothetical protein